MKRFLGASAPLLLAMAGCNTTPASDFTANAPVVEGALEESRAGSPASPREKLEKRIAEQARAQEVPASLIHAIVKRESNYNPSLRHGPYWGLMQIRHDTARSMGYRGSAAGLLDADTNMTYAVAYLANAYRVARGDERRAVRLYAGGYYYEAKRLGLLGEIRPAPASVQAAAE